jgi:hypothetical protein
MEAGVAMFVLAGRTIENRKGTDKEIGKGNK